MRFRFSLRSLFIILTLLPCIYFGTWELTKRAARDIEKNNPLVFEARSPAPFVITELREKKSEPDFITILKIRIVKSYSVWLFGPMIRTPFDEPQ